MQNRKNFVELKPQRVLRNNAKVIQCKRLKHWKRKCPPSSRFSRIPKKIPKSAASLHTSLHISLPSIPPWKQQTFLSTSSTPWLHFHAHLVQQPPVLPPPQHNFSFFVRKRWQWRWGGWRRWGRLGLRQTGLGCTTTWKGDITPKHHHLPRCFASRNWFLRKTQHPQQGKAPLHSQGCPLLILRQVEDQPDVVRFAAAAGSIIIRKEDIPKNVFNILTEFTTKRSTRLHEYLNLEKFTIPFSLVPAWNGLSWNMSKFNGDLTYLLVCCGKGNSLALGYNWLSFFT